MKREGRPRSVLRMEAVPSPLLTSPEISPCWRLRTTRLRKLTRPFGSGARQLSPTLRPTRLRSGVTVQITSSRSLLRSQCGALTDGILPLSREHGERRGFDNVCRSCPEQPTAWSPMPRSTIRSITSQSGRHDTLPKRSWSGTEWRRTTSGGRDTKHSHASVLQSMPKHPGGRRPTRVPERVMTRGQRALVIVKNEGWPLSPPKSDTTPLPTTWP